MAATTVDLPACREQLRSTWRSVESNSSLCQGSQVRPWWVKIRLGSSASARDCCAFMDPLWGRGWRYWERGERAARRESVSGLAGLLEQLVRPGCPLLINHR